MPIEPEVVKDDSEIKTTESKSKLNGNKIIEIKELNPTLSQAHLQVAQSALKPKPAKELAFSSAQSEIYAAKK